MRGRATPNNQIFTMTGSNVRCRMAVPPTVQECKPLLMRYVRPFSLTHLRYLVCGTANSAEVQVTSFELMTQTHVQSDLCVVCVEVKFLVFSHLVRDQEAVVLIQLT